MKKLFLFLGLFLVSFLHSSKYQDPFISIVKESKELKNKFYQDEHIILDSPAFKNKWNKKSKFTDYKTMLLFLENIAKDNKWAHLKYLGLSQENRKIPYLFLSNKKNKSPKVKVWIQSGIHGNEPAGPEGILALLSYMNKNKKEVSQWLSKMDIIILPRINLDGIHYFQRRTARNIDLNRDYIKLEIPEMHLLKGLFNSYRPNVLIDLHEYIVYKNTKNTSLKSFGKYGLAMNYDLLYSTGKNLNIDKNIRDLSNNVFINNIKKTMDENNLSHETYTTVRNHDNKITLYEASSDARVGRNAIALTNAVSILFETRGIGLGKQNFKRRVKTHLEAIKSILNSVKKNKDEILNTIKKAQEKVIEDGKRGRNEIIVKSERKKENKEFSFIDISSNTIKKLNLDYYSSTNEVAILKRKRPLSYIIPPSFNHISKKLEKQGVKLQRLEEEKKIKVEAFEIVSNEVDKRLYEGKFRNSVKSRLVKRTITFPIGTTIVSMAQKNANLIMLALEPESVDSFATFNLIPVQKGDQFPVFRYTKE